MNDTPETRAIPTDTMDLTTPWRVRCFEPNRALFLSRPEGWGPSVARNIDGEDGLSVLDGGVGHEVGDRPKGDATGAQAADFEVAA